MPQKLASRALCENFITHRAKVDLHTSPECDLTWHYQPWRGQQIEFVEQQRLSILVLTAAKHDAGMAYWKREEMMFENLFHLWDGLGHFLRYNKTSEEQMENYKDKLNWIACNVQLLYRTYLTGKTPGNREWSSNWEFPDYLPETLLKKATSHVGCCEDTLPSANDWWHLIMATVRWKSTSDFGINVRVTYNGTVTEETPETGLLLPAQIAEVMNVELEELRPTIALLMLSISGENGVLSTTKRD